MTETENQPRNAAPPGDEVLMTHREILEVLAGLLAALFTALLSSTIVSTALPTIIGDLNGSQTQFAWVITTALLATAASTPIWGKLADLLQQEGPGPVRDRDLRDRLDHRRLRSRTCRSCWVPA